MSDSKSSFAMKGGQGRGSLKQPFPSIGNG